MKTAINNVISWIKEYQTVNGQYPKPEEIEAQLIMSLPKERYQIEEAYLNGWCNHQLWDGEEDTEISDEQYYNQTFKQ